MVIISCITFSKYRLARNKTLMSQPFYRGVVIIHTIIRDFLWAQKYYWGAAWTDHWPFFQWHCCFSWLMQGAVHIRGASWRWPWGPIVRGGCHFGTEIGHHHCFPDDFLHIKNMKNKWDFYSIIWPTWETGGRASGIPETGWVSRIIMRVMWSLTITA